MFLSVHSKNAEQKFDGENTQGKSDWFCVICLMDKNRKPRKSYDLRGFLFFVMIHGNSNLSGITVYPLPGWKR
jgi:predicted ATP-dependent endonuclease of OLD family